MSICKGPEKLLLLYKKVLGAFKPPQEACQNAAHSQHGSEVQENIDLLLHLNDFGGRLRTSLIWYYWVMLSKIRNDHPLGIPKGMPEKCRGSWMILGVSQEVLG